MYDPERFTPENVWNLFDNIKNSKLSIQIKTRHVDDFCAFAAGPRNCIGKGERGEIKDQSSPYSGQKFAMHEMKVVMAAILRKYKLKNISKRWEWR